MKVRKDKFDALLAHLIKTPPVPMKKIETKGKRGSKKALFPNPSKP
jgi:hypothetical protein